MGDVDRGRGRGRGGGAGAVHEDRGFPPRVPRVCGEAEAGVRGQLMFIAVAALSFTSPRVRGEVGVRAKRERRVRGSQIGARRIAPLIRLAAPQLATFSLL